MVLGFHPDSAAKRDAQPATPVLSHKSSALFTGSRSNSSMTYGLALLGNQISTQRQEVARVYISAASDDAVLNEKVRLNRLYRERELMRQAIDLTVAKAS